MDNTGLKQKWFAELKELVCEGLQETDSKLIYFIKEIFKELNTRPAVQVSDGEVRHFGPGDVVLVDDTTGKGHVSWVTSKTDFDTAVVQLPT